MDLQNLVNNVKRFGLNVAENFVSVPKESKFREGGVLTPEEFVAAGDHLVHHCPTWKWAKCGDPKKFRDWLPEDKQFLITKNVPCHKRCRQLMAYDPSKEKILSWNEVGAEDGFAGDEDSGWVDTHHGDDGSEANNSQAVDIGAPVSVEPVVDEDAVMDLDDFADSEELDSVDPNRFVVQKKEFTAEVTKPRTYDLHICYDLYYRVPRLFLIGYDENRQPLTIDQTNEDFSVDHANKTITFEPHTSLDCDMPSVHPCRHAETMKRLMDQYAENGKDLAVHEYLLIFLKFVQAVIPTIEYDFTRSIKL